MLKMKKLSIILVLLMLSVLMFAACEPDPVPIPPEEDEPITIMSSVGEVLNTVDNNFQIISGENLYHIDVAASCTFNDNDYTIVFKGNIDPTEENNQDNRLVFEVKKTIEDEDIVHFGFYYHNEVAYLRFPLSDNTYENIYIEDFDISKYTKDLIPEQAINNQLISNVIASFMERVDYEENGSKESYTFTFNLSDAFNTVLTLISQKYSPIDFDIILGMFGYSLEDLEDVFAIGYEECNLTFQIDNGLLTGMNFDNNNGVTFDIVSILMLDSAKTITMPTTLSNFVEYSPTNFDLSGKITLEISEGEYSTILDGVTINSDLQDALYEFDLRILSNTSLFAPETDEILIELAKPDSWCISFYYDGASESIYADLTEINAGKLKMSGSEFSDIINNGVDYFCDEQDNGEEDTKINRLLNILGIMAPGINVDDESAQIRFNAERFRNLFSSLGIVLPIDIESAGADIVRDGINVESVNAWIELGGIRLELETDMINIGPAPVVPAPNDLQEYSDTEDIEVYNIELLGQMEFDNSHNVIDYIESIISYLVDDEIEITPQYDIVGNDLHYHADIGIGAESGSLDLLEITLYDLEHRYLIGLGYFTSTDKLYIITKENDSYVYEEYELNYDGREFIELITGVINPIAPADDPEIGLNNTISGLLLDFNYTSFVSFIEFLGQILFNASDVWDADYIFESASIILGDEIEARLEFANDTSFNLKAQSFALSYEPIIVESFEEPKIKYLESAYIDNNMPKELTLNFTNGTQKVVKVNEWHYDTEGYVSSEEGVVIAYTELFGTRLEIELRIAASTFNFIQPVGLPPEGKTYDKNDLSVDPIEDMRAFDEITIYLPSGPIVKELNWDLSALSEVDTNGQYGVHGIIHDFFGRPILWPSNENTYKIDIEGLDIISHTLDIEFDAYNTGFDPRDPDSYLYPNCAYLTATGIITTEGSVGYLMDLEWDISNIESIYNQPNFNPYISGIDTTVSVNIPNSLGVARWFDVNLKMYPAEMTGLSFEGVYLNNGKLIDSGLDTSHDSAGISWDLEEEKLVINPLRIRELTEDVLPASVIMYTANGDYLFNGLKWEIVPTQISNTGGNYGEGNYRLNLIIGDSIGGYQQQQIALEVLNITVSNFELLNDDEEIIETSDVGTLHKLYEANNPYNYNLPTKTIIYTPLGDFILETEWVIPEFDINTLYNGGTFEATYQSGSQELKTTMVFMKANAQREDGLDFTGFTDIHFEEGMGLVFNPYTSEDFADVDVYPTKALGTFLDGQGNTRQLEIPIRWDISNITSLFNDANPNLYLGMIIEVSVYTDYDGCGEQKFETSIYVEEAKIDNSQVVYSQDNPTKLNEINIFANDAGTLKFTDPRKQETYPDFIRVSYLNAQSVNRIIPMEAEDVSVDSWDLSNVIAAYEQAEYINEVSGVFDVTAKVGTTRGGFQYVTMQVNIIPSDIEDIEFIRIPKLENGNNAFDYIMTSTDDYIATFIFDPYMADIKDTKSYPQEMEFNMDIDGIISFSSVLDWNLDVFDEIQPYMGGEYIVQALLPLDDESYIPINVRVIVLEKYVDTLNGQGLFNIFIDPLDETPFGRRNTTSMTVNQVAQVTFVDDDTTMELNLTYSREGLLVDFGGASYEVDAVIGNDFGGYQPLGLNGKVQVSVIQREIESIQAYNDQGQLVEIFRRDIINVGGMEVVEDSTPNILYYNDTPENLYVKFTNIDDIIEIPFNAQGVTGLSFEWETIDANTKEVVFYNIIPAFIDDQGNDTVFANNPTSMFEVVKLQDIYEILILDGEYNMDYSGASVDILAELESRNAIVDLYENLENYFEYEYYYEGVQIYPDLDPEVVKDSGLYTVRIYVKGHHIYGGYAEVDFTIKPRDLSEFINIFRNGVQVNSTGGDVVESLIYTGEPIEYIVEWSNPFTYGRNIYYPDGSAPIDVGQYLITIDLDDDNNTVYNTIDLTITKAEVDETSQDVSVLYTTEVTYKTNNFTINELNIFNDIVDSENYSYFFYLEEECINQIDNISLLDVGTYYVKVICDADNYSLEGLYEFEIVPSDIDPNDIDLSVSTMNVGETEPEITLIVFDNEIDLGVIGAIITYYDEEMIEVADISTAPYGQYYVKVEVTLDNYNPIDPIASFYKLSI